MGSMHNLNTIAGRVAYARLIMEWNQTELAAKIGIKAQAIQQIENGKTKHSKYPPDIAEVCYVPFKWILEGGDLLKYADHQVKQKTTASLKMMENNASYLTASTTIGKEVSEIVIQALDILTEKGFVTINNIDTKKVGEMIGFAFDNRTTKSVTESTSNVVDYLKFVSNQN